LTKRNVILALVALAVVSSVAYLALLYGHALGSTQAVLQDSASRGVENVVVLRALRRGDTAGAISLLETSLDSDIVSWSVRDDSLDRHINLFFDRSDAGTVLMTRVSAYREKFPSSQDDREIRALIMNVLKKYPPEKCGPENSSARPAPGTNLPN
jgi:hypothetical protein